MKAAAQIGYDAIEIHARENIPRELDEILSLKAKSNMEISALVTGKLYTEGGKSLTSKDDRNRREAIEGFRRYIELARLLGTDLVLGWLRGSRAKGETELDYCNRLADVLHPLEAEARKAGVRIMIECINRYEIDTMNTALQTVSFIREFDLTNTYVHLDTFHMNIEEANMNAAIVTCGDKLGYFHVADNTRCHPGSGSIDFVAVMKSLVMSGYSGYVDLECLPRPDGIEAAVRGLNTLRSALLNAENEAKNNDRAS